MTVRTGSGAALDGAGRHVCILGRRSQLSPGRCRPVDKRTRGACFSNWIRVLIRTISAAPVIPHLNSVISCHVSCIGTPGSIPACSVGGMDHELRQGIKPDGGMGLKVLFCGWSVRHFSY
jgi:hypothetical protein